MGGWTAGQSSATPTSGRELLPAPGRGAHPGGHLSGAPGRKEAPLRHSGRSGAPKASHAFSSTAPAMWAKPAGPGSPRASAPSCLIHIHHIHEGMGAGPALPAAPRPRPGIPPRRRLRPQWGAPGFRFGEGVSTWSRLKNVSRPLLRRSSLPQGVSVGSPPCEGRSKEARERTAPLPWERSGRNAWKPAARSLLVPVLAFFHGMGFKSSTSSMLGKRSTTELRPLTICFERRL